MKNRNYLNAKRLTLIPLVVWAVTIVCSVLSLILEFPTHRGAIYSILAIVSLMSILLSPLPCLMLSVLGMVFAIKARKENIVETKKFFVLSIVEIIISILGVGFMILFFISAMRA